MQYPGSTETERQQDVSQQQPSGPRGPRPTAAPRRDQQLQGSPAQAEPLTPAEDRQWATLAHFGGILGFVPSLAIYLVFRHRGPFTAQEAKEALNFAVPPTLLVILLLLLGLLPVVGPLLAILGALVWIAMACYGVMGASNVSKGRPFRYPFNLRILR